MTLLTGWTWDVRTKQFGHDPIYAPKVLKAARMVLDGVTTNYQRIIDTLQFCFRPAKPGDVPKLATPTGLRRLLQNRMLMGERVIDKKHDLTVPKEQLRYIGKDGKLHRRKRPLVAREPHEVYIQKVPPLISRKDFEQLQLILRAKSDKRHQSHALHEHREQFTYRGLLFCAECERPMYTRTERKGRAYYRCRDGVGRRGGTHTCKASANSMQKARLEAELDRVFSREFGQGHFVLQELKERSLKSDKAIKQRRQKVNSEQKKLDSEQKKLESKRTRAIDAEIEGFITKEDRDRRVKVIDADLDTIRREREKLAHSNGPLPTEAEWQRMFRPFKTFRQLSTEEKRQLVSSRFQEIKVQDYRVVSLYLLTGEAVAPKPLSAFRVENDPTRCRLCSLPLLDSEIAAGERLNDYLCAGCKPKGDRLRRLEDDRVWKDGLLPTLGRAPSTIPAGSDSFQRL